METNNNLLYCKTCHKQLSKDAKCCPHCGDIDPFFFEKLRKSNESSALDYIVSCLLAMGATWLLTLLSLNIEQGIAKFIIFLVLYALFFIVGKLLGKKAVQAQVNEHGSAMQKVCEEADDIQAYIKWKQIVDEIIG